MMLDSCEDDQDVNGGVAPITEKQLRSHALTFILAGYGVEVVQLL
jgi:hypothetical protein